MVRSALGRPAARHRAFEPYHHKPDTGDDVSWKINILVQIWSETQSRACIFLLPWLLLLCTLLRCIITEDNIIHIPALSSIASHILSIPWPKASIVWSYVASLCLGQLLYVIGSPVLLLHPRARQKSNAENVVLAVERDRKDTFYLGILRLTCVDDPIQCYCFRFSSLDRSRPTCFAVFQLISTLVPSKENGFFLDLSHKRK